MTTRTMPSAAARYAEQVARLLADLPDEERSDVLQDLEAHLTELGSADIEKALGTPEEFVAEFRDSAGLDLSTAKRRRRPDRLRRVAWAMVMWLPRLGLRLVRRMGLTPERVEWVRSTRPVSQGVAYWERFRPVWLMVRGWLAVSLPAVIWGSTHSFDRFPIPVVAGSTLLGLTLVIALTALSFRADRRRTEGDDRSDRLFTGVTLALLAVSLVSAGAVGRPYAVYQEVQTGGGSGDPAMLVGPDGPIGNIFAYDLEGNPVDVLLYDDHGDPIRLLPSYAYDVWSEDRRAGIPFIWNDAEIRFETDTYGRPLENLYPYDRYVWSEDGSQGPVPPPVIGFPSVQDSTATTLGPATTTAERSPRAFFSR